MSRRHPSQRRQRDDDRKQAEDIRRFDAGEFRTQRYKPTDSIRLKTRLGKIIPGPIGKFFSAGAKAGIGLDSDVEGALSSIDFGDAVEQLFKKLDEEDPVRVIEHILQDTDIKVEGPDGMYWDPVDIDRDFDGNMMDLYKVVPWVLRFNYKPMADALQKKMEQLKAKMAPKQNSENDSAKKSTTPQSSGSSGAPSSKETSSAERSD